MNQNQKQVKYSIRKFAIGSFSVAIGFFFAQGNLEVKANNEINLRYEYVKESELTDLEKQHIIKTLSNTVAVEEETYFMVYRPLATTKTPLATNDTDFNPYLAVGGIAFIVCIFTSRKNKKAAIASFVLITTMGQVIPMTNVQALESKALRQYAKTITLQKGDTLPNPVVKIDGHQFIGYILGSELVTKQVEQKTEQKIEQKTEQKTEQKVETKVDKQPLITALAQLAQLTSKQLDLTTKTPMSRNRYEAALQVAKMQEEQGNALLTQDDITQELITKTTQSVTEASKALARAEALLNDQVDKEALRLAKAALLASVDTTNKTPNSIQAYETAYGQFADEIIKALQQADTVIANADASEETVATILQQLIALKTRKDEAQKLLVEQADKTNLQQELARLQSLLVKVDTTNRTPSSIAAYEAAHQEALIAAQTANTVLQDQNVSSQQVEMATSRVQTVIVQLEKAKEGLRFIVSKAALLEAQIRLQQRADKTNKTPKSIAAYDQELTILQPQIDMLDEKMTHLYNNPEATEQEINALIVQATHLQTQIDEKASLLVTKADKTKLSTKLEELTNLLNEEIDTSNKTEISKMKYEKAKAAGVTTKAAADAIMQDDNVSQEEVQNEVQKITDIIRALQVAKAELAEKKDEVNKTQLQTEIMNLANKLSQEEPFLANKTPKTQAIYEAAKMQAQKLLAQAQQVFNNETATQEEVDAAAVKVVEEIKNMIKATEQLAEKAEKTVLQQALLKLDERANTENKKESSVQAYNKLIANMADNLAAIKAKVNEFLADENATKENETLLLAKVKELQDELDTAASILVNKVNKNTLKSELDKLKAKLAEVLDLTNKTPESKARYEQVKQEAEKIKNQAQAIYDDENATQQQVESMTEEVITKVSSLDTAKMQLEEQVNKEELNKQIVLAEAKKAEDYTTDSYKKLTDVLAEAKRVSADESADQKTVDAKTEALKQAVSALERIKQKPTLQVQDEVKKDALLKTAEVSYTLTDTDNAYKSAVAKLYKKSDHSLIATVNVMKETDSLKANFTNLEYDVPYEIETTFTYDIGKGDVTETLATKKEFELILKKIELKNIDAVELYGKENDTFKHYPSLRSKPTNLSNYFVKVKSDKFKDAYLPVSSVSEEVKAGKNVFKFVVKLSELVQNVNGTYAEQYVFYVEKVGESQNNVYTSFKALIDAIKENPSGTFTLGADVSADEIAENEADTSYLTTAFTGTLNGEYNGEQHVIYDLKKSLFNEVNASAVIKNISLKNVDIVQPSVDQVAALAKTATRATIQNVSAEGRIVGLSNVAGLIHTSDNTTVENAVFKGSIHVLKTDGNTKSYTGGIIGNAKRGNLSKLHADVNMHVYSTSNNYKVGGLIGVIENVTLSNSYVKGKLINSNRNGGGQLGGIIGSNWSDGKLNNVVSFMEVENGYITYGDKGYIAGSKNGHMLENVYVVENVAKGTDDTVPTTISETDALAKVKAFGITETTDVDVVNKMNQYQVDYTSVANYDAAKMLAYRNTEKLLPFYNKEFIVKYGNKIATTSNLAKKEILSITPMENNNIVSDLKTKKANLNKILVRYSDDTIEYFDVTFSKSFDNTNITEYTIQSGNLMYTPESFNSVNEAVINNLVTELQKVEYQSDTLIKLLGADKAIEEWKKNRKKRLGMKDDEAIKQAIISDNMETLFLRKSFEEVKANLPDFLTKLIMNDRSINGTDSSTGEYLTNYIKANKEKLLIGLAYLNRWYGIQFKDMNIKDLMLYHQDFNGNTRSILEHIVRISDYGYDNMLTKNNVYAYNHLLSDRTNVTNIFAFLDKNRTMFTQMNEEDWFKSSSKAYIVESKSKQIPDASVEIYKRLKKRTAGFESYILPLLTLSKEEIYIISNMTSVTFGMYERYMDMNLDKTNPERYQQEIEKLHKRVDMVAEWQRKHYDTWYRLLNEQSKPKMLRDISIWDGYYTPTNFPEQGNPNKEVWRDEVGDNSVDSIRDFFGPIGKWFHNNRLGAYADGRSVYYILSYALSQYGGSLLTHEMTHNSDGAIYFNGYGRREGLGGEVYALGFLQAPNGADHPIVGLNLMYDHEKNNKLLHNSTPDQFQTFNDVKQYVHGMKDMTYLLDYAEAQVVLSKDKATQKKWYNKIENLYEGGEASPKGHATSNIREFTNDEWEKMSLTSVNDLIDNEVISKREYRVQKYQRNGYSTISLFSPIYGVAQNDFGAPGDLMFRSNAYDLLAAYGYYEGLIPYATNQYKAEATQAGQPKLPDSFVLSKIFNGDYKDLKAFKKAMYQERIDKKDKLKTVIITWNKETVEITNFEKLKELMQKAVEKDIQENKIENAGQSNVIKLKKVIYNAYLLKTREFRDSIFND